jgi:tetratricopeptide (TPR) repeat protein
MRHYAWLELQLGVLHLKQGNYDKAWGHYQQAERAYSGYWLVDEHKAELLGAQGKLSEAAALYEDVVARVPRPEFQQALCELYSLLGQPEKSQYWRDITLDAYLASAHQGQVHYYHHLTDFFADVVRDGNEALRWAQMDFQLRENFATQTALAWAFYRAGDFNQASAFIDQALTSGVTDAHTFFQAGKIYRAAGGNGKADQYFAKASAINPHLHNFHVHR